MVKVIIENDGERKELTGDFTLVTVVSDEENSYSTDCVIVGEFDKNQFPHFLAHTVFDNMNSIYKDETPTERIFRLVEFESYMEALIMSEITENKDVLDLSDETKFVLDLVESMKE